MICFNGFIQLSRTPKRRRSEPEPEPDEATEIINGVTVTEEALKKIGRNVLKSLGIGLDDRKERITSLSHNKRRAVKTLQVRTRELHVL